MSIREHGPGYQVRVYNGQDGHGRPSYLYRTAPTLKEAKSLERRLATEVERGRHRGGRHTFQELLDGWWALRSPDLAENTRRGYEGWKRRVVEPELGHLDLAKLTPDVLDQLYSRLREQYAARTIRQIHAIVRGACGVGVRWSWLASNPAADVRPPKVAHAAMRPPEPDEARAFLAALTTEDPDLGLFLRLAAILGARRGELCGLRWSDIDWDSASIAVARSLVPLKDGAVAVKAVKSGPAHRVSLDAHTLRLLECELEVVRGRAERLGGWDSEGYLFTVGDGHPWHPDHATGRYRRAARRHGMKARLHDWRHYAATQMLDAGIPVKTVADRLGHASASVTLSVYAHSVPATDRAAAVALAATLD